MSHDDAVPEAPIDDPELPADAADAAEVPVCPTEHAAPPRRPGVHLVLAGLLVGTLVLVAQGRADPPDGGDPGSVRVVGDAAQVPGVDAVPYVPGGTIESTPTTVDAAAPTSAAGAAGDSGSAGDSPFADVDHGSATATSTAASGDGDTPPTGDGITREIPAVQSEAPAELSGPWSGVTSTTAAGYVATQVGCASGTSAGALDAFFRERVGPLLGEDYQHVYALGGNRYLWLFQDAFVDHSGAVTHLGKSSFVHNVALIQDGSCFTLYHRGTTGRPAAFEQGDGETPLKKWFWPMGGELANGRLVVFWVEMRSDGYVPDAPDGLGWHPARTWIATYDPTTLQRLSFRTAPDASAAPIYGYAVASQGDWTYLFGNTFEQNMIREGGYANGPHSATAVYLARVPRGQLSAAPEYRTADGWTTDRAGAVPIVSRFWVENPMQPRFVNGQWASVAKVDGYWGEELVVDVAADPWGPWTTVDRRGVSPRGGDPLMNTYHAHLLPWLEGGSLAVSISQNARAMTRDAYPQPSRYRIGFFTAVLVAPPPPETTTTSIEETSSTVSDSSTSSSSTSVAEPTTTAASTTTSSSSPAPSTSGPPASTTSTSPATSTTAAATTTSTPATSTPPTTVAVTSTTAPAGSATTAPAGSATTSPGT